jgi:hypothetical protein
LAIAGCVVVSALVAGYRNEPVAHATSPSDWVAGDVHVHAAGDSGLGSHLLCRSQNLSEQDCADLLVRNTLTRAKTNGVPWVILTEHVPWLGANELNRRFCPVGSGKIPGTKTHWPCALYTAPTHNTAQALREYHEIQDAARRLAPQIGVRALMGQELGTAAPFTYAGLNRARKLLGSKCDGVESGHFGVYYESDVIDDGVWDCDESRYLNQADAVSAWGAINHPDNIDQGSRWFCWNAGDRPYRDENPLAADGHKLGKPCAQGAATASATRAVEIVNDMNLPTVRSTAAVDSLLLQGHKVALVGGGDAHSSRPNAKPDNALTKIKVAGHDIPWINTSVFDQQVGSSGKIGLVGRTYIPSAGFHPPEQSFDPNNAHDPVRLAIKAGRTIASTGPLAVPTIGDRGPGETVTLDGTELTVNVRLSDGQRIDGAGITSSPTDAMPIKTVGAAVAAEVDVRMGRLGSCPPAKGDFQSCTDIRRLKEVYQPISPGDRSTGSIDVKVSVPADLVDGYVRVDVLYAPLIKDQQDRFGGQERYTDGAFASPIYVKRAFPSLPKDAYNAVPGLSPVHEVGTVKAITTAPNGSLQIAVDRLKWHWCGPNEYDQNDPLKCADDYELTNPDGGLIYHYALRPDATIRLLGDVGAPQWKDSDVNELLTYLRRAGPFNVDLRHARDGSVTGIGQYWVP